jgi:ligand-binding sensor domain-containing protein/DNA-binding CsgD family transcriptional regulator
LIFTPSSLHQPKFISFTTVKKTFCFLLALFFSAYGYAQNTIGLPEIINYTKKNYGAGTQTWDIKQDPNGILYFANNDGLLVFDGNFWKTYPLPNKTIARSVLIEKDKIYVGGQDELGYFTPDRSGRLNFHSLKQLIPEKDQSFADVWDILKYENQIFFRTSNKIFHLTNGKIAVYYSKDWRFMGISNGDLVVQDFTYGLLRFRNGVWAPFLKGPQYPHDFLVTALLPFGKEISLVTTFRNGCYIIRNDSLVPFRTKSLDNIADKLIYTATLADDNLAFLATTLGGGFVIDTKGNVKQYFSRQEGLQNNNILSVFSDDDKNLWLGLDNGIDFIAYDSPVKHIYTSLQNEGSGYTSIINEGELYIGTSNGLYAVTVGKADDISYVQGSFKPVPNTKGQVWNLSEVNGRLLMGHHEGAFIVNKNEVKLLDNSTGFWTFLPFYNVLPSALMVSGTYYGIKLYDYQNSSFRKNPSEAHFESARFVTVDNATNTIWVAHPYKGIYKVNFNDKLQPAVRLYSTRQGLTSINNNYIFKIRNQIIATTEQGIFEYNPVNDLFQPSVQFRGLLDIPNLRYVKEDMKGNIWFVHDKNIGVIDVSGEKPRTIYLNELTDKLVNGFEHVYPVNENNILIGAEKGFFHLNYAKYREQKRSSRVLIRTVRSFGKQDSVLFGGYSFNKETTTAVEIPHTSNSVHFEYSSTLYGSGNITYSYLLEGYDKTWSDWTQKVEKEYTNLPAGKYAYQVKAHNNLLQESEIARFSFIILPPWYQTWWAYAIYVLLFLLAVFFLHRWQKKKFILQHKKYEEEQKRLQYLHQLELEKTEKELIRLRNEKLEAEIAHKNTELASTAMHLVQKGELMSKIKDEMTRMRKDFDVGKNSDEIKKIIKVLNEEDKFNEDWENFAIHFDKVHSDFLTALKSRYPTLTPNELKLSGYLRMNLSTKEVAQLMNISVRGVEISRYRLRKKLALPTQMNLFDFLMSIGKNEPVSSNEPIP